MTLEKIRETNAPLAEAGRRATEAYEQAARDFDGLKEFCIAELGMQSTGEFIHGMAHEFPKLFDKIGDILHQRHIRQYYGETKAFTKPVNDLENVFSHMTEALFEIDRALESFIAQCDKTPGGKALGRQAEELQIKNSEMTGWVLEVWTMYKSAKSAVSFDNWVGRYNAKRGG